MCVCVINRTTDVTKGRGEERKEIAFLLSQESRVDAGYAHTHPPRTLTVFTPPPKGAVQSRLSSAPRSPDHSKSISVSRPRFPISHVSARIFLYY